MCHVRAAVLALVFAIVGAGIVPESGGATVATPSAGNTAKPKQPVQPATGPGGREALFGDAIMVEQVRPGELEPDYWIFVPSDPIPGAVAVSEPRPLVIFGHSYTRSDPGYYLGWIEHLVRRGAVVLFPEFEEEATDGAAYRDNLLEDVRGALNLLRNEGVALDLQRVAVVGHSVGGVLAVDYAASAAAAGLPVPMVVLSVAPGCPEGFACLSTDMTLVPATTRVLIVVEADDADPSGGGTVERIWNGLSSVPQENRDIVTLVSDTHGAPWLLATHDQAHAARPGDTAFRGDAPDALDWYGTWKWLDALMGCAFEGLWCSYALGNTPEQRFMGMWSDGVPVAEALVGAEPE